MGIFSNLKDKIFTKDFPADDDIEDELQVDYLISLGVLLWIVAEADEKFLPQEQKQIEKVLCEYGEITQKDLPIVLRAIEEANIMRVDVQSFTRDVRNALERKTRLDILDQLFRVACVDGELNGAEHEIIRKIADLLGLDHKEFIDSKIKVKKEFGLNTIE